MITKHKNLIISRCTGFSPSQTSQIINRTETLKEIATRIIKEYTYCYAFKFETFESIIIDGKQFMSDKEYTGWYFINPIQFDEENITIRRGWAKYPFNIKRDKVIIIEEN